MTSVKYLYKNFQGSPFCYTNGQQLGFIFWFGNILIANTLLKIKHILMTRHSLSH